MRILFTPIITFFCLFGSSYAETSTDDNWKKDLNEKRTFFREHGYLWIKNFFSPSQVILLKNISEKMQKEAEDILALKNSSLTSLSDHPKHLIVVSESSNPEKVCRTEDMLSLYPGLFHLMEGSVKAFVSLLMEEPYTFFKDKLNYKWPGGGAFPPHQDYPAYEKFGPREHITAMVCIDPATFENGCLHVAKNWKKNFRSQFASWSPENSKEPVLPYVIGGKNHGSIEEKCVTQIDWLALTTNAGDLVIFNSFVPHFSHPNRSNKPRRAMFLTMNRLYEGDFKKAYYRAKRSDPRNPLFHFATPTDARTKN
jgi:2-aminoethylphosphonate dioxygenase